MTLLLRIGAGVFCEKKSANIFEGFASKGYGSFDSQSIDVVLSHPMKSPKKPAGELSLPSQDEYRRFNVLQEQTLSKFQTIGEALSAVREDVNSMKSDFHAVKEDVAVLKAAAYSHSDAIRSHSDAIHANTDAIRAMQTDLKHINQRLVVVETKLAS